ncbi:unnamed protein product [Echinostoma caproni]|uniref:Uncharacterized protein n=1 Tax=Echinostoma caproni TaxID=27848 RepID=A0A183ASM3_9TREM|nr:unnamed protein product [Echinostoma caproni]
MSVIRHRPHSFFARLPVSVTKRMHIGPIEQQQHKQLRRLQQQQQQQLRRRRVQHDQHLRRDGTKNELVYWISGIECVNMRTRRHRQTERTNLGTITSTE